MCPAPQTTALASRLSAALEQCGARVSVSRIGTPKALAGDALPADGHEGVLLVLAAGPDLAIGLAIQDGMRPGEACDRWAADVPELLSFCRCNRRRTVLVDAAALIADPAAAFAMLAGRLGLTSPSGAAPDISGIACPDALSVIFARQALGASPEGRKLASETMALALPLGQVAVDADAAFEQIALARRSGERAGQEIAALIEKAARLEAGAASHQADRAGLIRDRDAAGADAAAWKAAHDLLCQQMTALQEQSAQYFSAMHRSEGGASDLHQRLEALQVLLVCRMQDGDAALARTVALEAELAASQAEIGVLRDMITTLHGSTSWRITTPLRSAKTWVSGARRQEEGFDE